MSSIPMNTEDSEASEIFNAVPSDVKIHNDENEDTVDPSIVQKVQADDEEVVSEQENDDEDEETMEYQDDETENSAAGNREHDEDSEGDLFSGMKNLSMSSPTVVKSLDTPTSKGSKYDNTKIWASKNLPGAAGESAKGSPFTPLSDIRPQPNPSGDFDTEDFTFKNSKDLKRQLELQMSREGIIPRPEYSDFMTQKMSTRTEGVYASHVAFFVYGMSIMQKYSMTTGLQDLHNNMTTEVTRMGKFVKENGQQVTALKAETSRMPKVILDEVRTQLKEYLASLSIPETPKIVKIEGKPKKVTLDVKTEKAVNEVDIMRIRSLVEPYMRAASCKKADFENEEGIKSLYNFIGEAELVKHIKIGWNPKKAEEVKKTFIQFIKNQSAVKEKMKEEKKKGPMEVVSDDDISVSSVKQDGKMSALELMGMARGAKKSGKENPWRKKV